MEDRERDIRIKQDPLELNYAPKIGIANGLSDTQVLAILWKGTLSAGNAMNKSSRLWTAATVNNRKLSQQVNLGFHQHLPDLWMRQFQIREANLQYKLLT